MAKQSAWDRLLAYSAMPNDVRIAASTTMVGELQKARAEIRERGGIDAYDGTHQMEQAELALDVDPLTEKWNYR